MGYRAFRARKRVHWDGWLYAPPAGRGSSPELDQIWNELLEDRSLTQKERAQRMEQAGCHDERACDPAMYGGDIVLVRDEHMDRAETLLRFRTFAPDAAIPSVDELLKDETFKRLTQHPVPA